MLQASPGLLLGRQALLGRHSSQSQGVCLLSHQVGAGVREFACLQLTAEGSTGEPRKCHRLANAWLGLVWLTSGSV